MMENHTGLCLIPTFAPPVICPRLMSTHQKLQMMFDVTLDGPKSAPNWRTGVSSQSVRKHVFQELNSPIESPKLTKDENTLNLFEGALSYAPQVTPVESMKVIREGDSKSRKRESSVNTLLQAKTSKRQKPSATERDLKEKPDTSEQQSNVKENKPKGVAEKPGKTSRDSNLVDSDTHSRGETSELLIEDFKGIQNVCKNAGASLVGLNALRRLCMETKTVHLAFIFQDLSCNHAPSSVRYCKPSSRCQLWYCSCDKVIRTSTLKDALLATLITLPDSKDVFLLPLITCLEPVSSNPIPSARKSKVFPFRCETSQPQRLEFFLDLLQNPSITKILFHSQAALLSVYGAYRTVDAAASSTWNKLHLRSIFDPKIAAYLLNSDITEERLELYELLSFHHIPISNSEDVVDMGKMTRIIQKIVKEARQTHLLFSKMCEEMSKNALMPLFWEIEMPLTYSLSLMEFCGVHILPEAMKKTSEILTMDLEETEKEIYRLSGFKFNVASPDQVSTVLYERLRILENKSSANPGRDGDDDALGGSISNIRIQKKQRHLSTSEEELKKMSHLHPVIDKILHYRATNKLLSTYIEGIMPFVVNTDNSSSQLIPLIHAIWNQTAVRTGRLSCCKPNMQNIPSSTHQTSMNICDKNSQIINIRNFFSAKPGFVFLAADYSQIEVRILAHVCHDPTMIELFQDEKDIYRQLAGKILNQPLLELVPDNERNKAKTICLGILYGMGAAAAAQKLGIEIYQAHQIINSFYQKFQQVKKWMETVKHQTKEFKKIRTLAGRIRHLPDIVSEDSFKRSAAERQAINSIIQGSASDIIKYAMVCMERLLQTLSSPKETSSSSSSEFSEVVRNLVDGLSATQREKLARSSLVMQIHDELIFEVPDDPEIIDLFIMLLREMMEKEVMRRFRFDVPLRTNISKGKRWGEFEAITGSSSIDQSSINA